MSPLREYRLDKLRRDPNAVTIAKYKPPPLVALATLDIAASIPAEPAFVPLKHYFYADHPAPIITDWAERKAAFDEAAQLLSINSLRDQEIEWADRPELANYPAACTTVAAGPANEASTRVAARSMFKYSRLRKAQVAATYRRQP